MARFFMSCGVVLAVLIAAKGASLADERFVPQGHSYSPDRESLPQLNSHQDRFTGQVDIYQTEIYTKQRERALWEHDFRRASNRSRRVGPSRGPRY